MEPLAAAETLAGRELLACKFPVQMPLRRRRRPAREGAGEGAARPPGSNPPAAPARLAAQRRRAEGAEGRHRAGPPPSRATAELEVCHGGMRGSLHL